MMRSARLPWAAPGAAMIGTVAIGAAAIALLCGCTEYQQTETVLTLGDEASYTSLIQPYVGLRCGSLDCHGDSGRALRLYATDGLRLRAELRGQAISNEELQHNIAAFAGASPDAATPAEHIALLKGLAVTAGGFAHVGGDVWMTTQDPGYACLAGWLANNAGDVAVQTACTLAYDEVAPASATP